MMPDIADRPPWVRIVIVAFNPGGWLADCVAGLARQDDADFEAVIVDNGCTDGSVTALALPDARFRILSPGRNLGFAAGSNLGAAGARTDYLAMLNPDAVPDAGWLRAMRQASLAHPDIVMFGSTQCMADAPDRLDGAGDCYSIFGIAWRGGYGGPVAQVTRDIESFSPCAAGALYRRDAFEAVGGFAEGFFCYLEDVDLGFRLRLAGGRGRQLARARLRHAGSVSTGRDSAFTLYHSARNGLFLLLRCMPIPLLMLALPLYLLAQFWLCLRRPDTTGPRLRGLAHGIQALPGVWRQRVPVARSRRIGWRDVASLLVWNPSKVSARAIVPLAGPGGVVPFGFGDDTRR